jgi:hypothetical protein
MLPNRNSKEMGFIFVTFVTLIFVALTSMPVHAQVAGATMTGTVNDSSGAVIPNAQLSIRNVATGEVRTVTTDKAGFYSVPNLLPGLYDVTVTAPGFSTAVRSGITLTVGAQQVLNMTMNVGQISQKVEVTGEAPVVQLASSDIGGVINQTTVVELPLNGRDWTQLATLQPGVISIGSIQANPGGKDRATRGYGTQMTISGSRPQQNNYRIDGISINDYSNGGPGSVEGSTLGVDAVQEFSVLTSNYSAEYGRTSGGVINAITKSGTNSFHGDGYEFLRNSALDARNYFDPATIPEFRRNQFGGSVGGPIWKDHTFFFADYEGLRQNQGITALVDVPSQAVRNGILCSIPQPGVCSTHQVTGAFNPDPATGIDKAVLPFLGLWPLPNQGVVGNGDTGIFHFGGGHITSENFVTLRIDHKISGKDSVYGSYEYDPANATQPDNADELINANNTGRSFISIEETHIFNPQLVNSARFGYSRNLHTSSGLSAINPLSANLALGESPGTDNPMIDVPGLTSANPGLNQAPRNNNYQNSFQGYDDVFLTKGLHSLKFGFAVERLQLNQFNYGPAGEFPFNSLEAFLTNQPSSLSALVPSVPTPHLAFRTTMFGGYVQDDVRLRANLTINLGLRYEMSRVPTEIQNRLLSLPSPTASTEPFLGTPLFQNPTLRDFAPRIGFAWDPFGNGKTSIRSGFGMFDVVPLLYLLGQFASNAAPFLEGGTVINLPPGSFPTKAFNIFAAEINTGTGLRLPYVQPNPKRNYVMQWNLNVQRELAPNLAATVAYVGSRGVHQPYRSDDINSVLPITTSPPYLWPSPTGSGKVLSPTVGRMDSLQWINDTFFEGLEAEVVKKMSHGIQVQGSYTWSRAIDEGAGSDASDPFLSSIPSLFFFLPKYRRAAADFNVSQNLVLNYIWNIPTPSSFHGPAAWAARGWQLGGIFEIRSGLPFTPLIGGDPLGLLNSAPFAYPDRLRGSGCGSLVNPGNVVNTYIKLQCFALPMATPAIAAQCVPFQPGGTGNPIAVGTCSNRLGNGGRNEVYGPGLENFDFSVFKDNKIKENLNVQFRMEFFNVFNHSNFEAPIDNSTLFDSTGAKIGTAGLIDATSTTNREIQFALKLIF